jgi:hypothetical protein
MSTGPIHFPTEHDSRDHVQEGLADEAGPDQRVAQVLVRPTRRCAPLLSGSGGREHGRPLKHF